MDFNNANHIQNLQQLERRYDELTQELTKEVIKFASGQYLGNYQYIVRERAAVENEIRQIKSQLGE